MKALLYDLLPEKSVRCNLCHHRCKIKPGKRGICNVRENRDGELYSLVYKRVIARSVDPVEKKPMFHVAPGSLSYSFATVGCNFRCRFCQNYDIAQMPTDMDGLIAGEKVLPEEIVADALERGCKSIAYTYNEPTVFFELALETAKLASKKGFRNIFVTNGYMTPEAIDMVAPYMHGANVDLKAYNEKFYKEYCAALLSKVKESLVYMKKKGIFVEVTTLLIPGLNDDTGEIDALASFIADELGPETPWHISRFHPTYKLTDVPPTPVRTIEKARESGIRAGLKYVYTGNVPGHEGENTFCGNCGELIVGRDGYRLLTYRITNGKCEFCGNQIAGVDL